MKKLGLRRQWKGNKFFEWRSSWNSLYRKIRNIVSLYTVWSVSSLLLPTSSHSHNIHVLTSIIHCKREIKNKRIIYRIKDLYIYTDPAFNRRQYFFVFFFFEIGDDASKNISLSQAYHIPMSHKKTTKTKMLFKNHIMSLDAGVFADVARHWRTANDRIWHKWKKKNIWKQIFQTYLP